MTWYAQHREDKIAARVFRRIGETNRWAVEFGARDGIQKSNTAYFRDRGWTTCLFDIVPGDPLVIEADITAENVNEVFAAAGVPDEIDLLSIDIDGNDLWVWKALRCRSRVSIIEYNPRWNHKKARTVSYDPTRRWDRTIYYGASMFAMWQVATEKGLELVASTPTNLIFVKAGLLPVQPISHVQRAIRIKRPDPQRRKWVAYP